MTYEKKKLCRQKKGGRDTYRVIKTRTESRRSSGNIYNLKLLYILWCVCVRFWRTMRVVSAVCVLAVFVSKWQPVTRKTSKLSVLDLDSSCSFEVWTRRYETVSSVRVSERRRGISKTDSTCFLWTEATSSDAMSGKREKRTYSLYCCVNDAALLFTVFHWCKAQPGTQRNPRTEL